MKKNKLIESLKIALTTFLAVFLIGSIAQILWTILFNQSPDGRYGYKEYCAEIDEVCENTCNPSVDDCSDCCLRKERRYKPLGELLTEHISNSASGAFIIGLLIFGFALFSSDQPTND